MTRPRSLPRSVPYCNRARLSGLPCSGHTRLSGQHLRLRHTRLSGHNIATRLSGRLLLQHTRLNGHNRVHIFRPACIGYRQAHPNFISLATHQSLMTNSRGLVTNSFHLLHGPKHVMTFVNRFFNTRPLQATSLHPRRFACPF